MKKISIPIILSLFILFGLSLSNGHQKDVTMAKADPETPVATFTAIHSSWNPAAGGAVDVGGGHMAERYLLEFSENLGAPDGVNQTSTIGDHFQINGESIKSISTAYRIRCSQGNNRIMVDIPVDKIVATEEYPTPIFHIDGETPFGDCVLPELTFCINSTTHKMMQSSVLSFSDYNNNIDYTNAPHPGGGDHNYGEAPTNGAMMRILFDKNILGYDLTATYEDHTSVWGEHVTLNDVKLSEIDGALVGASFGRLYIFVPAAAIEETNHEYYLFPTLHIENTYFDACKLPEMTFRFTGAIGVVDSWSMREPTELTFVDYNNNIDYTEAPHPGGGTHAYGEAPSNGAVLRIKFNDNLVGDNEHGPVFKDFTSVWGQHVTLNGVQLSEIDGALVGASFGRLYIFVPDTAIEQTNSNYLFPTLHIENAYFDACLLPEMTFRFTGAIGVTESWSMREPTELTFVDYNNNIDYTEAPHPGGGGHAYGEAPDNGAVLRIRFNDNLVGDNEHGPVFKDFTSVWGQHVMLNGVQLSEIDGALVGASFGRLYIFVPAETINQTSNDYLFPTLHIENAYFDVCLLPEMTFRFTGAIGIVDSWSIREPTELTFEEFNNNIDYTNAPHPGGGDHKYGEAPDNGAVLRIRFNDNLVGDNEHGPVFKDFTSVWGKHVTLNDVKLSEIDGALVGASFGRLYIFVPAAAIEETNHEYYLFPTLHIENAYFDACKLPEMFFKFTGTIGSAEAWTKYESPAKGVISEDQYITTNNYSDLFADDIEVGGEKNKLVGQVPEYTNETNFAFEFKNDSKEGSFTIYAFSSDECSGIRLAVDLESNTVSLLDNSQGNVLGIFELPLRNNEWYRIYFGIMFNDNNSYDYSLAINDVIYLSGSEISISSMENFGRTIAIYSKSGITSFSDPRPGDDITKPVVKYLGEQSYHLNVGDELDLEALCSAFDNIDGDVSGSIEVIWPDGSLNGGKLNKGNWNVAIKSSDSSGNFDIIYVNVIVSDPNEVMVTFDGLNSAYYEIGSLIEKPEDPIKEEDKYATYSFIGWFNGDEQWDFENDHVTEDLNLVARFQKIEKKYEVSIIIEDDITNLYLSYGEQIDLSSYEKDGYTMTVTCNGVEYTQNIYEVREDTTITITYQKIDNPIDPSGPTNKDYTGLYIGLACGGSALVVVIESLVLIFKKKGNKKKA